ncbi:MAG: PRC-barrel domain-containing protein [Proteobacteria bacterium]|nr:PRC-barrel domain-containing protein [Pseudomonadota bacterium]MBU1389323.1 PRC-barrel domain-containing protein [Pseudomonadota bacterium]MBU1544143.1 PRC-barrel domain-containing protein [Pseudomonadota bacterium]MBU2482720.1 PRC-barrel domain-containing protein [Pseudomonadota bacterium]
MLRSIEQLLGYGLFAKNDDVGKCKDLLFDDRWWTIRYMVADTGNWLVGHQVLVSPHMIVKADWKTRHILLNISKQKLEECPTPLEHETVSREHEKKIFQYFGYPYYWSGPGLWGSEPFPIATDAVLAAQMHEEADSKKENKKENHLRSFKVVKGYDIKALDGEIGHVKDFIVDDKSWALRYVVVDTRNWFPGGKKVLLSLDWARSIDWAESTFEVDLKKEQIENAPEFDPEQPVNVETEVRLYDYYGRPMEANIDKRLQQNIGNPFL